MSGEKTIVVHAEQAFARARDTSRRPRAFWTVGPGVGELRFEPSRSALPHEVQVEALYGAISRGTESLVFQGLVPPGEHERMRGPHQSGDFRFPVKYGYSVVGRVVDGVRSLVGRTVLALHPHQDSFVIDAAAVVPVPEAVPARRAVLGPNVETALNVVWDAGIVPGDRVAVVGGGTVGSLVARIAGRIPGTEVTLVDIEPSRRTIAAAFGIGFATPLAAPENCDVVVHTSSTSEGLATALELAGIEATVVEASWYGARLATAPLGEGFHAKRLRLVSSQVGRVPSDRVPRWTNRRRLETAVGLLDDPVLDLLLAEPVRFDDLPALMPKLLAAGPGAPCPVIAYG